MLQGIPVPPAPPVPDVFTVASGPPEAAIIAGTMIIGFIILGIILYPLARALARRMEGKVAGGDEPRLLEVRIVDLEHRLADAEERLDFSERMLAQREPVALPREKPD